MMTPEETVIERVYLLQERIAIKIDSGIPLQQAIAQAMAEQKAQVSDG